VVGRWRCRQRRRPGDIDLDEVEALYTENGLWSTVFDVNP
jgi:hypothetical protein